MKGGRLDPNEPSDALVGARLGKYEVRRLLGVGGMGRVYEAWNPTISKRVAIKVLADEIAMRPDAAARFQREARAASAVESPYIVEIYDAGCTDDGRPFIVMELLRGETLASVLSERGPLAAGEVERIATQVMRGLERAHAAEIVHRDLKPDNIFLVDQDPEPPVAKILDFGVSKFGHTAAQTNLTRDGAVLGTPSYMSPEQAQGEADVDARSDLWSVGAILYECLTGRLPFKGSSYEQIIVRICTTDAAALQTLAPRCPDGLAAVVERCMRRERGERFASAAEVLLALGQAGAGSPKRRATQARVRESTTVGTASTIGTTPNALGSPKAAGLKRRVAVGTAIAVVTVMSVFLLLLPPSPGDEASQPPPPSPLPSVTATEIPSESETATVEPRIPPPVTVEATSSPSASGSVARPVVATRPPRAASAAAPAASVSAAPKPVEPQRSGVARGLLIQRQ